MRTVAAWSYATATTSRAWVDDEVTRADRDWVAEHHHGRALLHPVVASRGLTNTDITTLDDWLRSA